MRKGTKRRLLGFIGLILAMFMGALDATIVNIALPDIMTDLNASLTDASWVATIYVIAMAAFMITSAKLADIYGRKLVMLVGVATFGGFSLACMTANNLLLLVIYRFFQGVGGAIMTPIVLPMGIALFGKKKTSRIAAIIGAFSAVAAAMGPAIGGFILNTTTYHWIFGINVPIACVAFLAILIGTTTSYDKTATKKMDWFGMLLLILFMGSLSFGLLEGRDYGWSSQAIIIALSLSMLSLVLFIITELKVSAPTIDLQLFKERTFTASSVVYAIFGLVIIAPSLILNYFLQNVRGYSALHAAYLIMPASLAIAAGMIFATKIYAKMSARLLIIIGLLVAAGGLALLSFVTDDTSAAVIISDNVILGLGLGFTAMSFTASVQFLPTNKAGIGSGVVNAARYVGQAIGMALLVTALNSNLATAKTNTRNVAKQQVAAHNLSQHVKTTCDHDIATADAPSPDMQARLRAAATQTASLPVPKAGSDYRKLSDASTQLAQGTQKMVQLPQLERAGQPLVAGNQRLQTAIQLLAQKDELSAVTATITQTAHEEVTQAFSKVFLMTSLCTLLCVPLALLTDRKRTE